MGVLPSDQRRIRFWGLESVPVEPGETRLEVANDHAELAPGQEPGSKGTRRALTDRRKGSQGGANLRGEVIELPADLVFDGFWPIRIPEDGSLGRIRGGTQRVRPIWHTATARPAARATAAAAGDVTS